MISREKRSFLPLNHYYMITELGFHRRIRVDRLVDGALRKRERGVLEIADHRPASHPTEVALQARTHHQRMSFFNRSQSIKNKRY